ncbi:MAG TPA: ATP-binding protein, partial [Actinomycetota bacterium]|nr:ATP-binding protein [Actinomycetota bacterium]
WAYGSQSVEHFYSPTLKAFSAPGESEADFRLRLQQSGREKRDAGAEQLRKKYAAKTAALQERLRKAMAATEREAEQAKQAKLQTAISIGGTVLGAFLGRKSGRGALGRATTAARGVGRAVQQSGDVKRAEETVGALRSQLDALEVQFQEEAAALTAAADPMTETLQTVTIKPKKTDISVSLVALAWAPHFVSSTGERAQAW